MLRSTHCNLIFALLTIALLTEVHWNVTNVERFPFDYKRASFVLILPVFGVTLKRAVGLESTESSHNEIHLVYRAEFADRGMPHDFAGRAW